MPSQLPETLFATGAHLVPSMEMLGGKVPIILVDGVYEDPAAVRQAALELDYRTPHYPYPGRIAEIAPGNPSLTIFLRSLMSLVNDRYLPRVPPMKGSDGRRITAFGRVGTDFGIIDVHPGELAPYQRQPHTDPVPIFGLLYLNQEERGGTMFFDPQQPIKASDARSGYLRDNDPEYRLIGKIEGRYNRLAIYPGFVPHSGEIAGDWIETEERRTNPRLTQRFLFFP